MKVRFEGHVQFSTLPDSVPSVDPDSLTDPTSSVITPDVIRAYGKSGGDFAEAIPFCLLRAKATFLRDANRNRECSHRVKGRSRTDAA
jgi:hypothetical protein